MNKIITKIMSLVTFAAAFAVMFAVNAPTTLAAGINDNIPCSSSTMIAINGQYPNTNCWYTSVSGHDNQYFTVVVTVANSAPVDAPSVTVDVTDPGNGSGSSFSFHETIRVNGTVADSNDSASINITDGPGTLHFVQGYRYQAGQGGAGTPVSVSDMGNTLRLNMGTVPSGQVYSAKFEFQINSQQAQVDVCPNISGTQTSVPNGYQINNQGNCVPINTPVDVCPNLSGTQITVPNGYYINNSGNCVYQNINTDDLEITTDNADDVDDNSATLWGMVNDDGGYSVQSTYFYLSTSSSAVSNETAAIYYTSAANLHTGDDFSRSVSGLDENETYYFKACGQNTGGETDCGGIEDFDTDGESEDLEVETDNADDVDENSATLQGNISEGDNVDVWFEVDTDEDEVEDGDGTVYNVSNDYDNGDDFEKTISGLNDDTRYYFRACGEDEDGNESCGDVENFRTGEDEIIIDDNESDRPGVSTLPATSIATTSAQCNGVYASNGANTSVYFKYGTNANSLQFTTTSISQGNSSGSFSIPVGGLLPNTLYYCRAYAANTHGTVYGDAVAFRTTIVTVNNPPVITNTVFVNNGGGNGRANIFIENGVEMLTRGQQVVYHVQYKNISKLELENAVINVEFPKEIRPLATTRGTVSKSENSVTVKEDLLDTDADEEFFITAEIRGNANPGQLLTASATLAYDYEPGAKVAVEEAIAFDADTYAENGNLLAGLALFGGFFPGSLLGWLIILLILLAIFAIARRYYIVGGPRYSYEQPEFRQPPRADNGVHHSTREY